MAKPNRALGAGVNGLFHAPAHLAPSPTPAPTSATEPRTLFLCALDRIEPQPGQPRRHIDESKLAELAVRESEHRFRAMGDSAPVLIWLTDADDHTTWYNKPWRDFVGLAVVDADIARDALRMPEKDDHRLRQEILTGFRVDEAPHTAPLRQVPKAPELPHQ